MQTTELITPPRMPSASEPMPDDHRDPEPPTVREMLAETVPLADAIPGFGPPVALAVPGLLFVLALAGPFALVFTFVLLLVAATLIVLLVATILASPYLLVRHLLRRRTRRASVSSPAAVRFVPAPSQGARA
jgi:Flp pilus assembly protein TadB